MDARDGPSLSEVKVGVFVLVSVSILGFAIFTIGTQVGLLEETFYAKTYLNNVSGLKPGDVALLAGVEAGNVIAVHIKSGKLPDTESNRRYLREVEELNRQTNRLQQEILETQEKLDTAKSGYDQALKEHGEESWQSRSLGRKARNLQTTLGRMSERLKDTQEDLDNARSNLQNIEVLMEIQSQYRTWIRKDSDITLGNIGLLGDKFIDISLGRSPSPAPVIEGSVKTWLGTRTEEVVVITGTTQPGFEELITGADDVLSNLRTLSDKLGNILSDLGEGEGTVGRFVTDASFYENLNEAVVSAKQTVDYTSKLVEDLLEGNGTLAQLIRGREVYDKISRAAEHLEAALQRIDSAEGTLGKLINDPSIYEQFDRVMANMESITRRIEAGEGTLGKLLKDEQLYENLRRSLDQFASFIEEVEKGKGTLGRLAKDDQLYQNFNQVSSEIVKLIYDIRQNPKKFLTIKFELF